MSLRKLAAALKAEGVSVVEGTLRLHQKRGDAPKNLTVEAWKPYLEAHASKAVTTKSLAELREEKLKEEIRLLKLKAQREEGKTILVDEVSGFLKDWTARLDMALTAELEVNAPPLLAGKSIVEVREGLRAVHDRLREATKNGLLKWEAD